MTSLTTLKLGVAALIGLGAADLAWINLALGPRALATEPAPLLAENERARTDAPAKVAAVEPEPEAKKPGPTKRDPTNAEATKPEPAKVAAATEARDGEPTEATKPEATTDAASTKPPKIDARP